MIEEIWLDVELYASIGKRVAMHGHASISSKITIVACIIFALHCVDYNMMCVHLAEIMDSCGGRRVGYIMCIL